MKTLNVLIIVLMSLFLLLAIGGFFGVTENLLNNLVHGKHTAGGTHLPFANNLWFLAIASAALGGKFIIKKYKKPAVETVKA